MPEITVYTKTVCQPCKATKRKLAKHSVPFTEINVEENEDAAQFLRDGGYTEAPVVITSYGDEWTGFRPDLIEAFAQRSAEENR